MSLIKSDNKNKRLVRIVLQMLLLFLCILIVIIPVRNKVNDLFNKTHESSLARQVADLSLLADQKFEREIMSLDLAAEYLAPYSTEQWKHFFKIREADLPKEIKIGIIGTDGSAIW
ncbi:MAG: hypothetical protein IJU79_00835 [Desulfovibrionaceae bacterium]|nr:hypothetical protein [Desulfovibrionaceae bacterium]